MEDKKHQDYPFRTPATLVYIKLVKGWVILSRRVKGKLHETVCRQMQMN